jgi:hypothetical protein
MVMLSVILEGTMKRHVHGKRVYISGAISADPNFKQKFSEAVETILSAGAAQCLNPADLPHGWTQGEYMEHCMIMVRRSDVVVMLPCWINSPGAKAERAYAESVKIPVVEL